jgi:hypothetical protein
VRADAPIDRRNIGTMYVPGIFFLESLFAPAERRPRAGDRPRDEGIGLARRQRKAVAFHPRRQYSPHPAQARSRPYRRRFVAYDRRTTRLRAGRHAIGVRTERRPKAIVVFPLAENGRTVRASTSPEEWSRGL